MESDLARMIYQPSLKCLAETGMDCSRFCAESLVDLEEYAHVIRSRFTRGDEEEEEDDDLDRFADKDEKSFKEKKKEETALWLA